jgi:prepilin-type N-terminal cleavage/methylation domain-containing protein
VHVSNDRGFTLIEVLVVTVIVGVLAGIAIPHYTSVRGRAVDMKVASAVRAVATGEEAYFAARQAYAGDVDSLTGVVIGGVAITIEGGNSGDLATSFRVRGTHPDAPHAFVWISDPGPGEPHLIID